MNLNDKICIVGSSGMLGHAIWSMLSDMRYVNLIKCSSAEVDLCNQEQTKRFFEREKPDYVFFLAAVAAGISYKKSHPVDMLLKNLQMTTNVMESAYENHCKKIINVCSALLYPSDAQIPFSEEDATHVNLDEIDTPYALAKAAGMRLASYYNRQHGMNYLTVVPCNFFGPYAPFQGERAGVVPSLISRIHKAKVENIPEVVVWGSGGACREFLNSKDVASACIHLMDHDIDWEMVNIGRGHEYTIRETAETIQRIVGYNGKLVFDTTKPDGRMHMQLNTERLFSTGWRPSMGLEESIRDTYDWYLEEINRGVIND